MLFEFLLFDILRRPASEDDSSFFGVNAVTRFISALVDCVEPKFTDKKFHEILLLLIRRSDT